MTRLLLTGNPNVGKSTLFNALTGGKARVGNWHGVTVGALEGMATLGNERVSVCDLPGIYSLTAYSLEEKITRDYLLQNQSDVVLFLAECATLRRSLPLLDEIVRAGRKVCLILTKRRAFEKRGGVICPDLLSEQLKIPVFSVEGNEKKSVKALKERLALFLRTSSVPYQGRLEFGEHAYREEEGRLRIADKLLFNGFFCVAIFLLAILGAFYLTFAPNLLGDLCKCAIEEFFCVRLAGLVQWVSSPVLRSFLTDGIFNGLGGVLCFLPQIAILFLILSLLEESGFMSRLALHTDGLFAAVGLNGRAVFSLLMGFGCTAAAILTTRGLEDRRMQRRTILCLPYISCSAKLPVFLTLSASFFQNPFVAVVLLYAMGVLISFLAALFMKEEDGADFLLEMAPLQIPRPIFLLKSLLFQLKQFIIKTATVILAFFLLSWLLSSFNFSFQLCEIEESMLACLCGWLKFLFAPIGCADWKIAYCALSGLIAKENVAGLLAVFYGGFPYSGASAFAFACFILTCSPCVSAIAATAKEVGIKRAILYALFQTGSALIFSYLVYYSLCGGWVYLLLSLPLAFAGAWVGRKVYEKIRRTTSGKLKKLHR